MIAGVVPVKRLRDGKSRLASVLTPAQRTRLSLRLVERVVGVLRSSGALEHIAVVTPEADLAARLDVQALHDHGDLNGSLARASAWAAGLGAAGLMIVPADLPYITRSDVRALIGALDTAPQVVIARGRRGGTGALLLAPPAAIAPSFGEDSFARHVRATEEAGMNLAIVDRPGFCYDVDLPVDLAALHAGGRPP